MRTFVQWLRLMRFPLVFTAIGDAWAVRFMAPSEPGASYGFAYGNPTISDLAVFAGISFCLYAFGMILNDVMDAGKDPQNKPIPCGAIDRSAAAMAAIASLFVAVTLAFRYDLQHDLRLAFGDADSGIGPFVNLNPLVLVIVAGAAILIFLYDVGLKRIPLLGLLLLGLIRAVHCQIPAVTNGEWNGPAWNSLFLFAHVTVVSWIAYNWEGKQPRIRRVERWALAFAVVLIGFALFDVFNLSKVKVELGPDSDSLGTIPAAQFLIFPLIAAGVYLVILFWILASRRFPTGPDKGRAAMRIGLLWLLVYDAAFCAAAGRWTGVMAEAALLACAILSSRGMMWLSHRVGLVAPKTIGDDSKSR